MCCLAFWFPVKNEMAAMAIPITERSGRMTPVNFDLMPMRLDSSEAWAKLGKSIITAQASARIITFCLFTLTPIQQASKISLSGSESLPWAFDGKMDI